MKKDRPKSSPPTKRAGFTKRAAFSKPDEPVNKRPPFAKREGPPTKRASFVKREGLENKPFSFAKRGDAPTGRRPAFAKGDKPVRTREEFAKGDRPFSKRPVFNERDERPALGKRDEPPNKRATFVKREGLENKRPPFAKRSDVLASKSPAVPRRDEFVTKHGEFAKRDRPFSKRDELPAVTKRTMVTPRRVPQTAPPISKGPKEQLKTLDRVLSKAGIGSRTEARSWIGTGRVRVNGLLVQTPDYWVNIKTDKVTLDDKPVDTVERRYVLLNKPKGYITTYKDPEGRPTVYDLLKGVDQFLGTVGRLDLDTSGLLLLTNDTDLAEAITNPAYKLEKTYLVKAATLLTDEQLSRLRNGVELNDGPTQPAQVEVVRQSEKHTFLEITITEGRNRQVRRMLEAVESKVLKLVRVKLGFLTLDGLTMGTWRDLTEAEVVRLASGKVRPNTKTPPAPTV